MARRRNRPPLPARIVSGGQSGVDRAALDVALELGIPCGGWVPKGRVAEDGPLAGHYPLREAKTSDYAARARLNVRDSHASLVLARGTPSGGGTAMTLRYAERLEKPVHLVDMTADPDPAATAAWISGRSIRCLNVAGPRESAAPGIHEEAMAFLKRVFALTR